MLGIYRISSNRFIFDNNVSGTVITLHFDFFDFMVSLLRYFEASLRNKIIFQQRKPRELKMGT